MDKIKAAIIGCGSIYENHANAIKEYEFSEIVSVVDINEEKAKLAAKKYGCTYYTDYIEMLKDKAIDVVHICTPHYLHSKMAIDAMQHDKHVFTEKPLGISCLEGKNMLEESIRLNKKLCVCFQNRFNNTSIKAKEILREGTLGKIIGIKGIVTWNRDRNYYLSSDWRGKYITEGGGVMINQAIHTLDLMQWLGGEINAIKGNIDTRVLNEVIEVEDTADATFYFKNGAIGIFYATNCYSTSSPIELEIHAEKGCLRIIDNKLYLTINGVTSIVANDNIDINGYKAYWGLSHKALIQLFYDCILKNDFNGYVNAKDGIKSLEMIHHIVESSKLKQKISFQEM